MEVAAGAARWFLNKVRAKLSNDLLSAYVDSLQLGHNSEEIKTTLQHTHALLEGAEDRDTRTTPALQPLLEQLSRKADEAEDALDELYYFIIQGDLDGTHYAAPNLGDGLCGHARHGLHAVWHIIGNWLPCISMLFCDDDRAATAVANNPPNTTNTASADDGGHVDKLPFDRVAMSKRIKSLIEGMNSLCGTISNLLDTIPNISKTVTLKRSHIGSTILQDTLYGRTAIFDKTVDDITSGTHHGQTVSVLPIVGPGGIGKTTFTQHLYNNSRTKEHFTVRVWVCVSTNFDVLKLTQEILSCIPTDEKEKSNTANETTNLDQLQKSIAHRLNSKRFLIVLDDVWKCNREDWNTLLAPFKTGEAIHSMVLVTTRFLKLAEEMKTVDPIELQGLEPNDFFAFFEACIFGELKPQHYEDELAGIARKIASKLKGSPLAAKTVGRLLKKNLSWGHWMEVLKNKGWLNQQNNDDIMPSLKISYDYLPFILKKGFSYLSLFPEDRSFNYLEINRFWSVVGIIDSSHRGDKMLLEELVENGFLMKGSFSEYYVMHDLMHELSRSVSAQDCLNISDLDFRAEDIPQSVRHLSITIENRYDENFREEMGKLKGRIDIVNLRTLMIFRGYEERIAEILRVMFREINGLRVLFIVVESLESLPHTFSKLIHLQYLKIGSPYDSGEMNLPSTLSKFYHLKFLDLEDWHGSSNLPKEFSHLLNLRDFIAKKELHSNVPEVGKMKYLRELKKFHVKKDSVGFELSQLGELGELQGELSIHDLENVATKEEASGAKLMLKRDLKELRLVWGREQPSIVDADILDALQPHSNLRALGIENHRSATGPSWLGLGILVSLGTLHLEGVSWGTLPTFGQLPYLKNVFLRDLPELVEWVVEPNCRSFRNLESIDCRNCPNLCVMPFSECSCTNLRSLHIEDCPKLSLPPMPHTSTLTDFRLEENRVQKFVYSGKVLLVQDYNGAVAFQNLHEIECIHYIPISLTDLQMLPQSLRKLDAGRCDRLFSNELDDSVVIRSVRSLSVDVSHLTGELLSKVFNCFPALAELKICSLSLDREEQVIRFPSSSSLRTLKLHECEGLVLLPAEDGVGIQDMPSLQSLEILECGKLFSRWPVGRARTNHFSRASRGARKIVVRKRITPFPASLRKLDIKGESSMQSMALLSNLTSLTHLRLVDCENLRVDGFNPLITANLKELEVRNCYGDFMAADLLSEVARINFMPAGSFQLEILKVDRVSAPAVLVAPICNLLSTTLRELSFYNELGFTFWFQRSEDSLTEEENNALELLTSLQKLELNAWDLCDELKRVESL